MISLRYPVIFDNDCLASFLWVRRTDILHSLYGSNIIIPGIVINEFSYMRRARNKFVYDDLQDLIAAGQARVETLPITGPLANQFTGLENGSIIGKPLGKGESSAIVLTDHLRGTLAINNLRDIERYCKDNGLPYICTDNILYQAYTSGIITIQEGEHIWREMKNKKRLLPIYDFQEVVRRQQNGIPR